MKILSFLSLSVLWTLSLTAQFDETLESINSSLSTIETDKFILEQSISLEIDGETPILKFEESKEDLKKGGETNIYYTVNPALLDERKIERKISKNEMSLRLHSKQGNFILTEYEEKASKYNKEIKIVCNDIDMLRDLEVNFKSLIESTQELWNNNMQISEEYVFLKSQALEYGNEVNYSESQVSQDFLFDETVEGLININVAQEEKGKTKEMKYAFLLSDLDNKRMKVSTSKDQVTLECNSKNKRKTIKLEKDGNTSFVNTIKLYFGTPSEAFQYQNVLSKVIEVSESHIEADIESKTSCSDCHGFLKSLLSEVNYKDELLNLEGDCFSELTHEKEKETKKYNFNWGDLMRRPQLSYDKDGQKISFQVQGKQKFIEVYKNGEFEKYSSDFEFKVQNILTAKYLETILPGIIDGCERKIEVKDAEWLKASLSEPVVEARYEQDMEQTKDDCSYTYEVEDVEKGKSEMDDFNLYDLEKSRVKLNIKNDRIILESYTKAKEKLISHTDDKGKVTYANKLELLYDNLEEARMAHATFMEMIEGCKNE